MSTDLAIKVENLSKLYKLYETPQDRLKESLHPLRKKYHREFYALNDVSFEIKKGDTVGIIGRNGSGKSTLLKTITGVLTPSSGSVAVEGKISALLELGAGFNPELTGIENVYFNGTLMGYTREQMDAKLDGILAFADIGDFVYQPVKTYSSGMFVRLAFAVAVNVDPEILIVDEALSVGDVMFQSKCMDRIKSMMRGGVTTLFVTHSMDSINTLCNHAILLESGRIFSQGKPQVVTLQYLQLIREQEHAAQALLKAGKQNAEKVKASHQMLKDEIREKTTDEDFRYGTGGARIVDFDMLDSQGNESTLIQSGEKWKVRIRVEFLEDVENPVIGCFISNVAGQRLLAIDMFRDDSSKIEPRRKGDLLEVELESTMMLNPGKYLLSIGVSDIRSLSDFTSLDARKNICAVEVYGKENFHGMIHHDPVIRIVRTNAR